MKKCNFIYEADHVNNTIYVDVDSMKRAGQIDAPEYERFLAIKVRYASLCIHIPQYICIQIKALNLLI